MSSYKKLAKNTMIFALGSFGSKAVSFLMIYLYTRQLSKTEYGQVDLLQTTVLLLLPILSLQIYDAVFRFCLNEDEDKSSIFSNGLVGIAASIIISLLAIPFFSRFSLFEGMLIYFYTVMVLMLIQNFIKTFIRGIEKVFLYSISDILYTFLLLIFNVYFLVFAKMKIEGYFLAIILAQIVVILFLIVYGKVYNYIDITKINSKTLKDMYKYSVPLVPNIISWWLMNVSDRYMLNYFLGLSATGLYSVAYKIPSLINMIKDVFSQAWQISATQESNKENKDEFYTKVFQINFSLLVIITSMLIIFLKPILSIIVDKEFFDAWRYIPLLLIGSLFSALSAFYGVGYTISKKTIGTFYTSVIGGVVNVLMNIVLIPRWGIQAASFSTMVAFFVMWILRVFQTKPYLNIKLNVINLILSIGVLFIQIYVLYYVAAFVWLWQALLFSINVMIHYKVLKSLLLGTLVTIKGKVRKFTH